MKKLLIFMLVIAICASFAACAGQAPEATTEATTEPTETTGEPFDWNNALSNGSGSGCAMEEPDFRE